VSAPTRGRPVELAPAPPAVEPPTVDAAPTEPGAGEPAAGAVVRPSLGERLVPVVAAAFIRLLYATLRVEHHGDAAQRAFERGGRNYILAFWHRHLLEMVHAYRGRQMAVLISASRDGELIARTIARFGHHSIRGSSSRGGAAGLRGLLRRARDGWDLTITPDGPRGPARRVQPGVIAVAAASGLPVSPVAYAASRQWELRSWDRFVVPKPWSRLVFVYAEPLTVGRQEDPELAARRLEERLQWAEAEAERRAGRKPHRQAVSGRR
jgi:lysophospholipid acyltransferase (LPLAT)-like uncharacterized protein